MVMALSLTACSAGTTAQAKPQPSDSANPEFAEFLKQDFVDTLSRDYTTLHQYLIDPEGYGIDTKDIEVSFGHVTYTQQDKKDHEEFKKNLKKFDYNTLDSTQQAIYDQYQFDNAIVDELMKEDYKYLSNQWSSGGDAASSLINYFESIFILDEEKDIKDLITLIEDTPRYTEEILDYTRQQADKGLLTFDYDTIISNLDTAIASQENSSVYQSLAKQVDALNLDTKKADEYKEKIKKALDKDFYPCFTTMKSTLEELKDKVKPYTGLANKENGKKYYEMILRSNTGTTKNPSSIRKELAGALTKGILTLQQGDYVEPDITTSFQSPEEILEFMIQNYKKHYPEIEIPKYNIQNLPDEQSSSSIVAYYVPTPIDGDSVNQMRFNQRDYGQETTTVDFYTTFCHEGMPGHMYQHAYNKQNFQYDIQNLLDCSAFTEGYASYVQNQSLYDLEGVDKKSIESYIAMDNLNHYLICLMDIDINYNGMSLEKFKEMYGDMIDAQGLESIYNQLCDIPGTFLSYYYGSYKIQSLRQMAEEECGKNFDEVAFHQALLKNGSVNFEIVEDSIMDYIDQYE